MHKLFLKALSLNSAYRGRRFTTPELKKYKQDIALLSPRLNIPAGDLEIRYLFGVSSKQSDTDNLVKCAQDALAEKYKFNDRMVYKITAEKEDVKKGSEFISFEILGYPQGRTQ